MEGAPDMAGHKTGCFLESSLRPIRILEYSGKYFSDWVFGGRGWGWRSVLVCVHSLLVLFREGSGSHKYKN